MINKDSLSPEAREVLRAIISRRGLLAGAGSVSAAALLAACGSKSKSATSAGTAADANTIRWANWTLYMDYDSKTKTYPTLENFTKTTGLKVDYREDINDNDEFYGKVSGQLKLKQDIGYDIVTLTDWMAAQWIRLGFVQKFDADKIPNKVNILDSLANIGYDKGRNYSLTWQTIMAGFSWNKEKLPQGIHSLDQLFAPANKGKVEVLSEMRDTMGIIMSYQGADITKFTEDQFMNAIDYLQKKISDGFIRQVKGNDYKEDLLSGDAIAVIGWSGDTFQLAAENNDKFGFAVPDSGGTISSDNMMIPMTSGNKENAEKLINYYYDPAIFAQVAAYVNYIAPVKGAQAEMEKIDPKLAKSTLIFPDATMLSKVKVFRSLTPAEQTKFSAAFQKAIGN